MSEHLVLLGFGAIVAVYLVLDLGLLGRQARALTLRAALIQSALIFIIALLFGLFVYKQKGGEATLEYYSAYLMEYSLSLDNIFVIILILRYFSVEPRYHHKVLFWGILGAIIMRGIFIFAGVLLVKKFSWILYVFGAFLIWAGIRSLLEQNRESVDLGDNKLLKFLTRYLRITTEPPRGRFFLRKGGKYFLTTLMLALLMVEFTDLLFAVDSIPAAFAITQDEDVLYSSNIFAVMGLRSMFFILALGLKRFWALEIGIPLILVGIGIKMFLPLLGWHLPTWVSLTYILGTLTVSISISLAFPRKNE